MKICALVIMTMLLLCFAQAWCQNSESPSREALDQHRQFSRYTDPGTYSTLYENCPESTKDLCALIKHQLIHPFELDQFQDQVPEDRRFEDRECPTVAEMLERLLERDSRGLVMDRKPADRLIVACVHHSMLLASILRYRGVPVRIRSGYATYIGGDQGYRVTHVVCEVWDAENQNWFLVDPDRNMVDFPRSKFIFANQAWRMWKDGTLDPDKFISRYDSPARAIVHLLCHDLSYVLGDEDIYWQDPPIVVKFKPTLAENDEFHIALLDQLAGYLDQPEHHLERLVTLQAEHPDLQF